jgi:hypothetical protein
MILNSTKLKTLEQQTTDSLWRALKLFWMFSCFYAKYQSLHPYKRYAFITQKRGIES